MNLAATIQNRSSEIIGVRDEVLLCPTTTHLSNGEILTDLRIAFRLHGPEGAPVVLALGGISANRFVTQTSQHNGWWSALVGEHRALDVKQYQVLSIDWIGGAGDSTISDENQHFHIDTYDQAAAIVQVLDYLQISRLHLAAGASYGGMVVQQLSAHWPDRVRHNLIIAAAHRPNPLGTAWRSIQRRIIKQAALAGDIKAGLALARELAMTTYRSSQEFAGRFHGPVKWQQDQAEFPVESYLSHCGQDFCKRFTPWAFLCLSESIDLHQSDPAQLKVPTTLVGFSSDQLVPVNELEAFKSKTTTDCRLWVLDSTYGHDGFLKEIDQLNPIFRSVLEA